VHALLDVRARFAATAFPAVGAGIASPTLSEKGKLWPSRRLFAEGASGFPRVHVRPAPPRRQEGAGEPLPARRRRHHRPL